MPTPNGDPISTALQASLDKESDKRDPADITTLLTYSAKQVLLKEIDYEPYQYDSTSVLNDLKSKYIVINESNCNDDEEDSQVVTSSVKINNYEKVQVSNNKTSSEKVLNHKSNSSDKLNGLEKGNGLDRPEVSKNYPKLPTPGNILWPEDSIHVGWKGHSPVGSGFVNVGNSCYFNATLQALFHIPSFVSWLLMDKSHNCSKPCSSFTDLSTECLICACAVTLKSSQENSGRAIKPYLIYNKLQSICKQLNPGFQEDAHEFLRHLIDSLDRTYLIPFKGMKLDHLSKETTPLSRIFGGYLRNEVVCQSCGHVSTTFQYFQDMPLDIRSASHIDSALESFFGRETLAEHEGYVCESCKAIVSCTKKFSLEKAPRVLCIQLKRFGSVSGKNNKALGISPRLNLSRFRARGVRPDGFEPYELVSVVNHIGTSSACGHYTAVARVSDGSYYVYDDQRVDPLTSKEELLDFQVDKLHDVTQYSSHSYILLYEQIKRKPFPVNGVKTEVTAKSNNFKVNHIIQACSNSMKSMKEKCFGKAEDKHVFKTANPVSTTVAKSLVNSESKPKLLAITAGPDKPSASSVGTSRPSDIRPPQKMQKPDNSWTEGSSKLIKTERPRINGNHSGQNSDAKKLVPYNESSCESDGSVSTGGVSGCCSPEAETSKEQKPVAKSETNGYSPKKHQNGGNEKQNGGYWIEKGWNVTNHNEKSPKNHHMNKNHMNKNNWKVNNSNDNSDFRNKMNNMGHRGYGKPVYSWSGKMSDMESEVNRENFVNKRLMAYDDYDSPQAKKKMKYNGGGGHHFNPNNKRKFEDAQKQRWFNKNREWNSYRDFNRHRNPQPWYNHHS